MPLYNLRCTDQDCNRHFEKLCSREELIDERCPKCGKPAEQTISTFGHYAIKGNNSASVTPKKYRGGR